MSKRLNVFCPNNNLKPKSICFNDRQDRKAANQVNHDILEAETNYLLMTEMINQVNPWWKLLWAIPSLSLKKILDFWFWRTNCSKLKWTEM